MFSFHRKKLNWEAGIGLLENDVTRRQDGNAPLLERRRAPRVYLSVPVRFRFKGKVGNWEQGESLDVSRYGIRISTLAGQIQAGTRIVLEMKLPENQDPFKLDGVVVWAKPRERMMPNHGAAQVVECGVSFEDPKKVSHMGKVLSFLTDKLCQFALERSKKLDVRPVRSLEEMKIAYRLVYDQYALKGYCEPNDAGLFYTYYCVLPESQAFLLYDKGRLLGTLTLIPDSPCGLPMEAVFQDVVARFRRPGRKLAEVSLLALDLKAFEKKSFSLTDFEKLSAAFKLFKAMYDYARQAAGVTDLMITMHPKHQGLYQYLKFETIGDVRSYSSACNKPALPMHQDMVYVTEHVSSQGGVGSYFLREGASAEKFAERYRWNQNSAREFLKIIRPLWDKIPSEHQLHLRRCYPSL
ncbi:MAG: PilZ domain-containing protein [Candidatus Omnitrophica bacterium]|nr:PilZ domain-containing protein [Candidatus Omnitrophota bacterium]MDD5671231.1 PilZ domain-containing protein [Candidatus Omnitrophota bacterium]